MVDTNAETIIKLLTKKKRASAADLGTDAVTMKRLAKAGFVLEDGHIRTGGRGRPPVAWALVDASKRPDELPDLTPPPSRRAGGEGVTQSALDSTVKDVLENTYWGKECTCLKVGMTQQEIRELNAGCTAGRWVCGALDAVRRRLSL